jgi:hypothetical protein
LQHQSPSSFEFRNREKEKRKKQEKEKEKENRIVPSGEQQRAEPERRYSTQHSSGSGDLIWAI